MSQKLFAFILTLVISVSVIAQIPVPETEGSVNAKRQKEYVDFLRETTADVGNLHSLGNRISFSAELASLMWYHDEREARTMYLACIADFKELVGQYDLEMKSTVSTGENDTEYSGGILADMPERAQITRKFSSAMMVRQQLAMSMAERDPDLAFSFFRNSGEFVSSPELLKIVENSDKYFEFQLVSQVAQTDPEKAGEFVSKNLKNGVNIDYAGLLQSIYKKNPAKGAEFAQDMLHALKTGQPNDNTYYVLDSLLSVGTANYDTVSKKVGTPAMFSEKDMRDMAEMLSQVILSPDSGYGGLSDADSVARFAPARAAQIRAKFKNNKEAVISTGATAATPATEGVSDPDNANAARKLREQQSEKAAKQLADDVKSIRNKDLPKEERQRIIDRARAIIIGTPGRDKKIAALGMLAAGVAKAGDKELAASLMKDAQALVNPDPRNAQDFLLTWMLASAYAESNPDKAFLLLQDTISRLNETIAAFIKVGEFIDTAGEIMQDDEVQLGMFGGSMVRNMTSNVGVAEGTIRTLAKADFGKTRNLTNSFDRPEVRILAKMLVLRAVLTKSEKKAETTSDY